MQPFYSHRLTKARELHAVLCISHTLRSASGSLEQMQRFAVLVVDTGQTLLQCRVALLLRAGIGSESPVEVVLQSLVLTWMAVMLPDPAILRTYSK